MFLKVLILLIGLVVLILLIMRIRSLNVDDTSTERDEEFIKSFFDQALKNREEELKQRNPLENENLHRAITTYYTNRGSNDTNRKSTYTDSNRLDDDDLLHVMQEGSKLYDSMQFQEEMDLYDVEDAFDDVDMIRDELDDGQVNGMGHHLLDE